ncbi:hypothetical protein ACFXPX_13780 [Kitasatospora sp. NPDC059146]|uniref:hypothetical protein n=1 Tax=Kitasatospora sp. NPDC059146 TaxID=3346741 RepID=UPI0036A2FE42
MTLRRDAWVMLEAVAVQGPEGWLTGSQPLETRNAEVTVVRNLVDAGLCELAPADVLGCLPLDEARRTWAARITALGQDALRYRHHQENPTERLAGSGPDLVLDTAISIRGTDLDLLRRALADAEAGALTGIDTVALGTAIAKARPVDGSRRHTVDATDAELAAIMRVLYLESLYRDASGYHHVLRHSERAHALRFHQVKPRPVPAAQAMAGARIPASVSSP